jgi:hypothetical protein
MTKISLSLILGAILASGFTSGQRQSPLNSPGAELLVLPTPGIPISFEQIEEHTNKLDDGTFAVKFTITVRSYRDSAGRLLRVSETRDKSGHLLASSSIVTDPVNGFQTLLLGTERTAARMQIPVSSEARFSFAGSLDPSHKWKITTEDAGKRFIEGFEFEGSRFIQTAEDDPHLVHISERWYCEKLKLIGAVKVSGPQESFKIRIQNLRREEPNPKLFEIPEGFTIIDVK